LKKGFSVKMYTNWREGRVLGGHGLGEKGRGKKDSWGAAGALQDYVGKQKGRRAIEKN